MLQIQVTEVSLGMEAVPLLIHREVDLLAPQLDEHWMPMLVIKQASQGEVDQGVRWGQLCFTLGEGKKKGK